jgi:predicted permease
VQMLLGANLFEQARSAQARVPRYGSACSRPCSRVLAAMCLSKLVFMPLVMLGLVRVLASLGMLPVGDPILPFVLLVEGSTPPALNLLVLAELVQRGKGQVSAVLLATYVVGAVTMTAWMAVWIEQARSTAWPT